MNRKTLAQIERIGAEAHATLARARKLNGMEAKLARDLVQWQLEAAEKLAGEDFCRPTDIDAWIYDCRRGCAVSHQQPVIQVRRKKRMVAQQ